MMRIAADMHIHTVLSPCAAREMIPSAIAAEATNKGLAMIAVCDHNSAGNVEAVAAAAALIPGGPRVIPGIEITTREEVHILGFFPDAAAARATAQEVGEGLPRWRPLASRSSVAGAREPEQELVDRDGVLLRREWRMLAAASGFSLTETVDLIHRHGGLAVAAHMDRRSFSVEGQLGFLPPDAAFDGLEVSSHGVSRGRAPEYAVHGLPLLSSSDGHFLQDIGSGFTLLDVESPEFEELRKALRGVDGRRCAVA